MHKLNTRLSISINNFLKPLPLEVLHGSNNWLEKQHVEY